MYVKVAVIIPAYNDSIKLTRTLESLCSADTDGVEFIVVDDGSQPPIELPSHLSISYSLKLIRFEKNRGLTKALNAALKKIYRDPPEFIGRLDSGDLVDPLRFRKQLEFIQKNPDISVVGTWIRFYETENPEKGFNHQPDGTHHALLKLLDFGNPLIHSSLMMRTSHLIRIGNYCEEMRIAQDYDLVRRLSQVGKLAVIPEILTYCDLDQGGISVKRRLRQQFYRLKIQLQWFNVFRPTAIAGILRTLMAMAIPYSWVAATKKSR